MKLYLSRRRNGLYQLTRLEPEIFPMRGMEPEVDVYPRGGDPVVFMGLCSFSVHALFAQELQPCEVVRVELTAGNIGDA